MVYFNLLQMGYQMYTTVHGRYIDLGFGLFMELNRFAMTAEEIARKRHQLSHFIDKAQKAINELVAQMSPCNFSTQESVHVHEYH